MSTADAAAMRVEEASLNAWPAVRQLLYDGWVMRFSGGYTRRANSVNPIYPGHLDLATKIAHAERCYAEHSLPAVFRLNRFSRPPELDGALADLGYRKEAPTAVMARSLLDDLAGATDQGACPAEVREEAIDDWLPRLTALRGEPLSAHQTHRAILHAIAGTACGFSLQSGGETVACALGVAEGAYVGLVDVYTLAARRNRGFGRAVVLAVLAWARRRGAQTAYVQVMEENTAARHVYTRCGFEWLYDYWYRIRDGARAVAC